MSNTIDIFISNFRKQFTLLEDEEELKPHSCYTEMSGWDSLTALMILDMIDDQYDVGLTSAELRNCKSVQELFELVQSRRG